MEIVKIKKLTFPSKERAELEKLEIQMKEDAQLNWVLNAPIKELVEKHPVYKHLVESEKIILSPNSSLFNAIKLACRRIPGQSYFSLTDGKIEGFFAYSISGSEVSDIKIFSLYPDRFYSNLENDLLEIITILKRNYDTVNFEALSNDPINKFYNNAIEKFNGSETTANKKKIIDIDDMNDIELFKYTV